MILDKTFGKKLLKWFVVLAVIAMTAPFVLFFWYVHSIVTVYESPSPANLGSAVFCQETGMLDTVMEFYVRDYKASGSEFISLGMVSDRGGQGAPPELAVWSQDGSVVAVRRENQWIAAYDFRRHCRYSPATWTAACWATTVEELLRQRGSAGEIILSDTVRFDSISRHPWLWEGYP